MSESLRNRLIWFYRRLRCDSFGHRFKPKEVCKYSRPINKPNTVVSHYYWCCNRDYEVEPYPKRPE